MRREIAPLQLLGFAVTALFGTLLHFLYEWLGESVWVTPFSGVNESTWEHMKLLFWPMLLFALTQRLFFREVENFWCIKLRGVVLGLSLIPVLFYTYNGVIGKSPDLVNIAIFFISAAIAYAYEARQFYREAGRCGSERVALGALFAIALLFVLFTFKVPRLGIFKDPVTGNYGI